MRREINFYEQNDSWMNLNDDKPLLYELIEKFIVLCFIYPVFAAILYNFSHKNSTVYKGLLLFIAVLIMTVILKKIKPLWLFMLSNIAIVVLYFFIAHNLLERIVYMIFLIPHIFINTKIRTSHSRSYLPLNYIVIGESLLGVLYFIISCIVKFTIIDNLIIILSLVSILTFMAYFHIIRANKLMDWEQKYADKDSGNLNKFNHVFSTAIIIILSLLLLISYGLGLFKAAGKVDSGIASFFGWISSNKGSSNYEEPKQNTVANKNPEGKALAELRKNSKPTPWALVAFYKAMEYIIGVIVLIIIVALIIYTIREFYRNFYDKVGNPNEKREFVFSTGEIVERAKENFTKLTKAITHPMDLSNRKKMRKLYKKTVFSYTPKGVKLDINQSTREIENEIQNKVKINFEDVTNLYDIARYSKAEPSKENLNKMKDLINK